MSGKEHRPTERVLNILELIAASQEENGLSLAEVAAQLGCPKSTILPILHTLADRNYLNYNRDLLRYSLGSKLYEVGSVYLQEINLHEEILTEMQHIVDQCSESCHLAELSGSDVLYLLKVDSPQSIRMFSSPGRRLPANSTALGKALLSRHTDDELKTMFEDGLTKVTEHTVSDLNILSQQLKEVRTSGIASEKEENSPFIQCFAVPLFKNGRPRYALSVAIPTFRFDDEKGNLIISLLQDAKLKLEPLIASGSLPG